MGERSCMQNKMKNGAKGLIWPRGTPRGKQRGTSRSGKNFAKLGARK